MKLDGFKGGLAAVVVALVLGFVLGRVSVNNGGAQSEKNARFTEKGRSVRGFERLNTRSSSGVSRIHSKGLKEGKVSDKQARRSLRSLLNKMSDNPMVSMDFDRMFELWGLVRDMSEDQIRGAFELLDGIENKELQMTARMLFMSRWGKLNGSAAMDFVLESSKEHERMMGAMSVMMSWLKEDPEAAYQWYQEKGDKVGSGMFGSIYDGMMWQALASKDLYKTLARVQQLDGKKKQKKALSSIAQRVVTDPEKLKAFMSFLDEQGEDDLKSDVMKSALSTLAHSDIDAAKSYILSIADPEEKAKLAKSLADDLSWLDPEEAITWGVTQIQDEEKKKEVVAQSLPNWVYNDPVKATAWYDSQPESSKSDKTVKSVITQLKFNGKYEEAFAWTARYKNQKAVNGLKADIYKSWVEDSPATAKKWADGAGVSILEGIDLNATPEVEKE